MKSSPIRALVAILAFASIGVVGMQVASAGQGALVVNTNSPVTQGGTLIVSGTLCEADGGTITVTISIADLNIINSPATVDTNANTYSLSIPISATAPVGDHQVNAQCQSNMGARQGAATFTILAAPTTTQAPTTTVAATTTTGAILAETGSGGSTSTMAALAFVAILLGGGLVLVAARARSRA